MRDLILLELIAICLLGGSCTQSTDTSSEPSGSPKKVERKHRITGNSFFDMGPSFEPVPECDREIWLRRLYGCDPYPTEE